MSQKAEGMFACCFTVGQSQALECYHVVTFSQVLTYSSQCQVKKKATVHRIKKRLDSNAVKSLVQQSTIYNLPSQMSPALNPLIG